MTLAALEAGKHVLLEKPTAMNAAEAEELVSAARAYPDRVALIDHELRFLPSWREARARMAGEIGDVRYAEVRYSSPARGDRNREWNWWADATRGGGVGRGRLAFVDALRYFGREVESAQAYARDVDARRRDNTRRDAEISPRGRAPRRGVATMLFRPSPRPQRRARSRSPEKPAQRFIARKCCCRHRAPSRQWPAVLCQRPEPPPRQSPGASDAPSTRPRTRDASPREIAKPLPAATFEDGLMQQRGIDARAGVRGGRWGGV